MKIRDCLVGMETYVPGRSIGEVVREFGLKEEEIIRLNANENPLGTSSEVKKAIFEEVNNLHSYPEEYDLRRTVAEYVHYPVENIIMGNGGDGVLDGIVRLFVDKRDETIIPIPTFSFYEIVTRINGGIPKFLHRRKDFSIPVKEMIDLSTDKTKVIFLCSPNNPNGDVISERDVREIVESANSSNSLLIIDEAYMEFANSSLVNLVGDYDNVVVLRTFSKAFGLAGLRVGYAIVPTWISHEYIKVKQPFCMNRIGIIAGIAAIRDKEHLNSTIELVKHGRKFLRQNIRFNTYPSQANFILVNVEPFRSNEVSLELLKMGILVRDCSSFRGAGDSFIRVSVGTAEQNEMIVEALNEIKKSVNNT
jgi:histidinol-phosphate aminotransferase